MCCERRAEKARESTGEYVRGAHEGARVEERTWLGRRKADERRVDAEREVATPFLFLFIGFCANACGKAPVGDTENCLSVAVCRVFGFIFILHCLSFAAHCKCFLIHVSLNVLIQCSRFISSLSFD